MATARPALLLTLLLLAAMPNHALAGDLQDGEQQRPNVIFFFTDDQRADTIAALGNPVIKTPNLDALVHRGFVFHNAYCMGSTMPAVCNPSRHMMLSGMSLFRYQRQRRENTFGDVMRKAGYVTYHQSKRGNTAVEYHKAFEYSSYLNDGRERTSGHHGRTVADDAIRFLTHTWQREQPLFMYLGFAGPHDPRVADERWMKLYSRAELPLPSNYRPFHPIDNGELLIRDELLAPWPRTEEVVRKHLHDYYGCISSIDHHIGRVIETVADLDELDNTIIVFSSDHGLALGSHGLFGKQSVYQHSMNSPLIFAGPGIAQGRSDALAYLFDIFPTVVDLVGGEIPGGLDGQSLAPVLHGKTETARKRIFLAYRNVQRALRSGDWKLIRYPQIGVSQLFHLAEDPHETNDLSDSPEHQHRLADMRMLLEQQQQKWGDQQPLEVKQPKPAAVNLQFFEKRPGGRKPKSGQKNRRPPKQPN